MHPGGVRRVPRRRSGFRPWTRVATMARERAYPGAVGSGSTASCLKYPLRITRLPAPAISVPAATARMGQGGHQGQVQAREGAPLGPQARRGLPPAARGRSIAARPAAPPCPAALGLGRGRAARRVPCRGVSPKRNCRGHAAGRSVPRCPGGPALGGCAGTGCGDARRPPPMSAGWRAGRRVSTAGPYAPRFSCAGTGFLPA